MTISFSIRATASMGGGRSVDVAVEDMSATLVVHSNDAPMVSLRIEPMKGESQNG